MSKCIFYKFFNAYVERIIKPFDRNFNEHCQPGTIKSCNTWHTQDMFLRGFAVARIKGFHIGNSCWDFVAGSIVKTAKSAKATASALPEFQTHGPTHHRGQAVLLGSKRIAGALQIIMKTLTGTGKDKEVSDQLCLFKHFQVTSKWSAFPSLFSDKADELQSYSTGFL
jgi:hypothetical protein